MFKAAIRANSIAPNGKRCFTVEVTYPRFVHSELMTHRMFSRNAASSRAIPIQKMIERVESEPAMPVFWGANQAGMQSAVELQGSHREHAKAVWNGARKANVTHARLLVQTGLHKQLVNRRIEADSSITVIITATDWENFFHQRCSPMAQQEIRLVAEMIAHLYYFSDDKPVKVGYGDFHTPYITKEDEEAIAQLEGVDQQNFQETLCQISVARCARVSYLTQNGIRSYEDDLNLFNRLLSSGHWSPFEHVATPLTEPTEQSGNFFGWRQLRKQYADENVRFYEPDVDSLQRYVESLVEMPKMQLGD